MNKFFKIAGLLVLALFFISFVATPLAIGFASDNPQGALSGALIWLVLIGIALVIANWKRLFRKK